MNANPWWLKAAAMAPVCALTLIVLILGRPGGATADREWPSLQGIEHVAGRPATWDDVRADRAAISFVYDDRHRGRPVDGVTVPQYAYRRHAEGRERAILIQAEHDSDGTVIYGVRELASGAVVACLPENVTLLGASAR